MACWPKDSLTDCLSDGPLEWLIVWQLDRLPDQQTGRMHATFTSFAWILLWAPNPHITVWANKHASYMNARLSHVGSFWTISTMQRRVSNCTLALSYLLCDHLLKVESVCHAILWLFDWSAAQGGLWDGTFWEARGSQEEEGCWQRALQASQVRLTFKSFPSMPRNILNKKNLAYLVQILDRLRPFKFDLKTAKTTPFLYLCLTAMWTMHVSICWQLAYINASKNHNIAYCPMTSTDTSWSNTCGTRCWQMAPAEIGICGPQ